MTQEEIKELKKNKLETIRDYHQKLIDNLEIPRTDFNMEMAFYDKQGRNVVGIFASEFKKEKGFYFELITRDLEPLDAERTVYKIPSNSAFEGKRQSLYPFIINSLQAFSAEYQSISPKSQIVTT